jgi:hypothetical protein
MKSHKLRAPAAVIALAFAAGCGGGGSNAVPSKQPAPATHGKTNVTIKVKIPREVAKATSSKRSPKFVSSGTDGVLVQVYAHLTTAPLTGSSSTDVSPTATACGPTLDDPNSRTCTVLIPAPTANDDFVFTTYDAPPLPDGTWPISANILGIGTVTQQINSGPNTVDVALGGVIAAVSARPAFSVAADAPSNNPIPFGATDASGATILIDPYAAEGSTVPGIAVTLTENGGTGHASLVINSLQSGLSGTLAAPGDTFYVAYDGGGGPGYYATVALTAASGPGSLASVDVNPFYITSADPNFTRGQIPTVALNTITPVTVPVSLDEHGYTFSLDDVNVPCPAIATGGFLNDVLSLAPGTDGGSCTVSVTDGGSITRTISVTNSTTSGVIVIPSPTPSPG